MLGRRAAGERNDRFLHPLNEASTKTSFGDSKTEHNLSRVRIMKNLLQTKSPFNRDYCTRTTVLLHCLSAAIVQTVPTCSVV